ncbi:MAG: hypothetical protein II675_00885 [Bacteroidaceae bacterium]|nr:hypothetical protein [Bacteroidaceae bacterium]
MRHMTLRKSLLALLLTFAAGIFAQTQVQTFLVGEVSKSVILYQGNKKLAVTPGDELPLGAMLTIPEKGRLVVYNEAKMRQYTIMQSGTYTLAELLSTSKKKNVPEKAFKGIIKLVTSGDRLPDGVATIDREIRADSVATKETE